MSSLAVAIVVAAREQGLAKLDVLPFAGGGHADLTGRLRGGQFVAIETRNGDARLTDEQVAYANETIDDGGFYLVAKSVAEALDELRGALEDVAMTDALIRGRDPLAAQSPW